MANLVNVMSIMSKLQEWSDQLKNWIFDNYNNPLLWVGILVVAFVFFKVMFGTLNKN